MTDPGLSTSVACAATGRWLSVTTTSAPGHLLLALLREGHGIAAQVLTPLGADHARVREQMLGLMASADEQAGPQSCPG